MELPVTSFYAGLSGLIFLGLSIGVIRRRRAEKRAFGSEGDADLTRRVRAHGNFAEYVPLILLFLALLEAQGVSVYMLHAAGALTVCGRLAHIYSLRIAEPAGRGYGMRIAGMICTFTALGFCSVLLLLQL